MSKNIDKKLDNSTNKDLLYSEILNISVTEHVQELLQKKKKSCTFPVQRSSVLGRASKLIQSLKETENDVQNIEILEEGEPVIDMSVTLVDKDEEYEYESDGETNGDFENKTNSKKIISCDSDSDTSENESEAKVCGERSLTVSSDSESEVSENESEGNVIRSIFPFSNPDTTDYEKCIKTVINDLNAGISSDSDDNTQESKINVLKETNLFTSNSNTEQFNKNSKSVLEGLNNDKFIDSDDELSNEECRENLEKILEDPKLDLELITSVSPDSKHHNHNRLNNNLGLSGERKRKLIAVVEEEDEQHTCLSTKQKRV